jgi:hypothetical protein
MEGGVGGSWGGGSWGGRREGSRGKGELALFGRGLNIQWGKIKGVADAIRETIGKTTFGSIRISDVSFSHS